MEGWNVIQERVEQARAFGKYVHAGNMPPALHAVFLDEPITAHDLVAINAYVPELAAVKVIVGDLEFGRQLLNASIFHGFDGELYLLERREVRGHLARLHLKHDCKVRAGAASNQARHVLTSPEVLNELDQIRTRSGAA